MANIDIAFIDTIHSIGAGLVASSLFAAIR